MTEAMSAVLEKEQMRSHVRQLEEMETREQALMRLLIWRVVQDGDISDELLATLDLDREGLDEILKDNELLVRECQQYQSVNELLDLQDLFELARARVAQLLSACTKSSELRTLIACIRQLPGGKHIAEAGDRAQLDANNLLAGKALPGEVGAGAEASEIQEIGQDLLSRLQAGDLNRQQRRNLERKLRKLRD
jgi:hypothetical protein